MFRRKLQYLVKWEGYGIENNSWEYWDNLGNAVEVVADFHARHPGAPRHIRATAFGTIPFRPISPALASSRCSSRRGGDCKGNPLTLRTPLHTERLRSLNTRAHWTPALAEHSRSLNTCTCWTPALVERSRSPNTHAHWTLTRPDAYAPLTAITPFCTSSDLSHYFWTPCILLFTVYIRPCQQRDPYPFLFGSPARYVCV